MERWKGMTGYRGFSFHRKMALSNALNSNGTMALTRGTALSRAPKQGY